MAVTQAQMRATKKYLKKFDGIKIRISKEKKKNTNKQQQTKENL